MRYDRRRRVDSPLECGWLSFRYCLEARRPSDLFQAWSCAFQK